MLIPLSYASGMGGICTLIGTPPNLLISGSYTEQTGIQLSIFTPTLVGLFCLPVDDSHAKDGTGAQISGRRIGRNE